MNITVYTNNGHPDSYVSLLDASSKSEVFDSIGSKYTDDSFDKIQIEYDDVEVTTLDGKRISESGTIVTVHTLSELKTELGKSPDSYRMLFKKKKEAAKKKELVQRAREDLQKDKLLLASVIVATIREHWDTLEDKFEEYVDEDDYGNIFIRKGLRQEFVYFSQKVVLPELQQQINSGKTISKNVTFILQDTINVLGKITSDYFGIEFEDSDKVIANKLLSCNTESTLDDDLLYVMETNQIIRETYHNQAQQLFMQSPSITLNFSEKLKTSESIVVAPFVGLVFLLFSAMHNNKKDAHAPKKHHLSESFIGNDPYMYEEFIKRELRKEGFSAKRTRGSGDYGVDVIASKNGKTYAIQCKLYNHTVGTKAVQEIVSGRIFYRADVAIVVSDNSFTDAAKTLARRSDVILTHHKDLMHKIDQLHSRVEYKVKKTEDDTSHKNAHDKGSGDGQNKYEATEERKRRETDELITVILPTIRNDK